MPQPNSNTLTPSFLKLNKTTMDRVYNFSPGPSMIPTPVLEKAQNELLNWRRTGMSVMEISHRSPEFSELATDFTERLTRALKIPKNYRILYLSGGATGQFAAIPLNLRHRGAKADYWITGQWGKKAAGEAKKFIEVNPAVDTFGQLRTPTEQERSIDPDSAYIHYTHNETIIGVEYAQTPETGDVPLVGDFSSTLLSRPLDVARYGVIYACTQKNIGPAGTAVVIVREDLIDETTKNTPSIFDWSIQAKNDSMYNTPATFNWYLSTLVLEWIEQEGGLSSMDRRNTAKAKLLYEYIDDSKWYQNPVEACSRSLMNIPFTLSDKNLESKFLTEAMEAGLANLKGHRSIGGMRASLYNAMPVEGVQALIDFMKEFLRKNG